MSKPHRRFQLVIRINADTRKDLVAGIDEIGDAIHNGAKGPASSGGLNLGYRWKLEEDPDMTTDQYFSDLRDWQAGKRTKDKGLI